MVDVVFRARDSVVDWRVRISRHWDGAEGSRRDWRVVDGSNRCVCGVSDWCWRGGEVDIVNASDAALFLGCLCERVLYSSAKSLRMTG